VLRETARTLVPAPVRAAIRERLRERAFVTTFFDSRAELEAYQRELDDLWPLVDRARDAWRAEVGEGATTRGHPASFAHLAKRSALNLYPLVRKLQPDVLVETGVCNGVSSSVLLQALDRNGKGRLYSIDYPEYSDGSVTDLWEGKGGGMVPAGKQSGWLIPDALRSRWELTVGKSQEQLPPLLDRLGEIDFFMHDSEHSEECMRFELHAAARVLRPTGLLVVDDADWNTVFKEFVAVSGYAATDIGGGTWVATPPSR